MVNIFRASYDGLKRAMPEHWLDALRRAKGSLLARSARSPNGWQGHRDQGFGGYTYSQYGEDLIVLNIFSRLKIQKPTYLDIGAHHPRDISNTALLSFRESRGINVEANPELADAFRIARPKDINLNIGIGPTRGTMAFYRIDHSSGRNSFDKAAVDSFVRDYPNFAIMDVLQVDIYTINDVIDEYCGGVFPDFLSIDIEGLDYDVLLSADFSKSKPKVICVEFISSHVEDGQDLIGELLENRGYCLAFRTIANGIFIDKKYLT